MKWNKITIETTTAAEDMLSYELQEMGIEGVEVEDHVPLSEEDRKIMYVDLLPDEIAPDDGTARISCYIDEKEDLDTMVAKIRAKIEELSAFLPMGSGKITLGTTEEEDWINNWKQYFKQFYVDDILIIPSWEEVKEEDKDRMIIHIDPGTAFGTGMHETTQLCIRQIRKYLTGDTELLDIGTGSGILSIAALKLGAKHAVGTDLDPCAITATEENMEVNGISSESYEVLLGNLIDDREVQEKVGYGKYNMAVANILAEILVPLAPAAAAALKDGGMYITSGIISGKERIVAQALEQAGFLVPLQPWEQAASER